MRGHRLSRHSLLVVLIAGSFACSRAPNDQEPSAPAETTALLPAEAPATATSAATDDKPVLQIASPPLSDGSAEAAAVENTSAAPDSAAQRRAQWLTSVFPCRAIATVKFRPCRIATSDSGHSIAFQNDVRCDDIQFDENGDPQTLINCRSQWLSMPPTVRLKKSRDGITWSGSHSGWRWKSDNEPYCCPGIWLQAPKID
jgi:hypothetical protein